MKFYLVGGAVRDMLLGISPKEYDFVFDGTVDEFISRNPRARKAGNDFNICILNGIEYAPIRGTSIQQDLQFRDVTINALALDECGQLYFLPRTLSDLERKILRPASDTAFIKDPLRVFRVARFAAEYSDFTVHPDAIRQMRIVSESGLLQSLTAERVALELMKALHAAQPGRFLEVLNEADCLGPWFLELSRMSTIPAGPVEYHLSDCLAHTVNAVNKCVPDSVACYMALCHDLGKQETPEGLLPRHIGHEKRGEALARQLGERLKLPKRLIKAGALAARQHMKGGDYPSLRAGTKVDLLLSLHKLELMEPFFEMVKADSGKDHFLSAKQDLDVVLSVSLPLEKQNLGEESGIFLRQLRCMKLASSFSRE